MPASRQRPTRLSAAATALTLLLAFSACGGGAAGTEQTTTVATGETSVAPTTVPSTTAAAETTTSMVETTTTTSTPPSTDSGGAGTVAYFFVEDVGETTSPGPHLVPVFRQEAPDTPEAGVEALLAGPTDEERNGIPAISTAVPEGTELLDLTVDDGLATVDLSGTFDDGGGSAGMFGRLAQVVFTLTRDEAVDEVAFALDGEPVEVFSSEGIVIDHPLTRDDYTDQMPIVFVDGPAWGEEVASPFRVRGVANVFEAVVSYTITDDDGLPLQEGTVTASCGTGCWGEFEFEVTYEIDRPQFGSVIVWEASPEDGRQINLREYPIQLR